jgi:hypothetical protein
LNPLVLRIICLDKSGQGKDENQRFLIKKKKLNKKLLRFLTKVIIESAKKLKKHFQLKNILL